MKNSLFLQKIHYFCSSETAVSEMAVSEHAKNIVI